MISFSTLKYTALTSRVWPPLVSDVTLFLFLTSFLLFVIERLNDENPHPGDTRHSQIPMGCPPLQ